jgi:hypothetical protein
MMDNVKSQSTGTFKIEWPVVDEDALFRRALRDFESDAENGLFRFARMDIAGAEENEKIAPQIKRFDAVLIQLERFVVYRTYKIFAAPRGIGENRPSVGIFFGLREHKASELFTRKRTLAIKEGSVEVFIQRDVPGIKRGKRKIVAILKFFVIEVESSGGLAARTAVPAVGEDDTADVPKERCNRSQMRGTSGRAAKATMINVSR